MTDKINLHARTWFIFNITDGGPPEVAFESEASARHVAKELARFVPGKKFTVLEVKTCYESVPTTSYRMQVINYNG